MYKSSKLLITLSRLIGRYPSMPLKQVTGVKSFESHNKYVTVFRIVKKAVQILNVGYEVQKRDKTSIEKSKC